jgi:hypothetical protein
MSPRTHAACAARLESFKSGHSKSRGLRRFNAADEVSAESIISSRANHVAADSRCLQIRIGNCMMLLLRSALRIAPSKRLSDQKRDQAHGPARAIGKAYIEELVWCVGRVARREREASKGLE